MKHLLAAASVALALGACTDQANMQRASTPIPPKTLALMSEKGMRPTDQMLVRVYKKEAEFEVWKKVNGQYAHLKTFPICRWSGQLGPKIKEGDRQAPEGFYSVAAGQMNPNSSYYLSFDTGFPNAYDRAHDRTGKYLMVHGTCSSAGCYAMTDEGIAEVYAIARESFSGGQKAFQFQAYPFRMTAQNLARYRNDPNMAFWRNLKEGSDNFEITRTEPKVAVCRGRYAFNGIDDGCAPDPTLAPTLAQKQQHDDQQVAALIQTGTPSLRLLYADGGQHESFKPGGPPSPGESGGALASLIEARPPKNLGDVSRPDALAAGPREVSVEDAAPKPSRTSARSKPEPAQDGPTKTSSTSPGSTRSRVASADPDDPVGLPQAQSGAPLYERMMTGVFGSDGAPAAAPAAQPQEPAPPPKKKRQASSNDDREAGRSKNADRKANPDKKAKSETTGSIDERKTLSGAASIGPGTTAFKLN